VRPGLRRSPRPAAAVQEALRSAAAPLRRSAGLQVALLVRLDAAVRAAGDASAGWRQIRPRAAHRKLLTAWLARRPCGWRADPVYPPSLYKAISYASTLGVPVYILENGMPSKEDDSRRSDWINGCLAEVRRLAGRRAALQGAFSKRTCMRVYVHSQTIGSRPTPRCQASFHLRDWDLYINAAASSTRCLGSM